MIQNSISIAVKGEVVLGGSPPPVSDWILATGLWRDIGFWRDTSSWID